MVFDWTKTHPGELALRHGGAATACCDAGSLEERCAGTGIKDRANELAMSRYGRLLAQLLELDDDGSRGSQRERG